MYKFLTTIVLFLLSFSAFAQQAKDTSATHKVFNHVEQMPVFPENLSAYLGRNVHYPEYARRHSITGRVILKFVIDTDGSVTDVRVVQGIGGGCDEEAERVVSSMPKWKPGYQDGRAVKVYFTLPFSFALADTKPKAN
jgi:protein TonB